MWYSLYKQFCLILGNFLDTKMMHKLLKDRQDKFLQAIKMNKNKE